MAEKESEYFDTKMAVTMVVVFLIIVALVVAYMKFAAPTPPAGSFSAAQYNAMSAADKAKYKLDPAGSGYYVLIG